MRNYAMHIDPAHRKEWLGMASSTGIGLILRSMKVDYKFVSYIERTAKLCDLTADTSII
jgi:hypothetical protein